MRLCLLVPMLLLGVANAGQAQDAVLARNLAAACFSCHGTNGNALPGATNTEATSPQEVTNFPVPAGTKTLILKTSATGQNAAVTGTFYRCTVDLKAP